MPFLDNLVGFWLVRLVLRLFMSTISMGDRFNWQLLPTSIPLSFTKLQVSFADSLSLRPSVDGALYVTAVINGSKSGQGLGRSRLLAGRVKSNSI